jgi:hypothetical protein
VAEAVPPVLVHDIPTIREETLRDGQYGRFCFSGERVAPLSAVYDDKQVTALRSVFRFSQSEQLYGLLERADIETGAAVYGLCEFARSKSGRAALHTSIESGHLALIHPEDREAKQLRELPWRASIMPTEAALGDLIVAYRGEGEMGMLFVPAQDPQEREKIVTELPENWWYPYAA